MLSINLKKIASKTKIALISNGNIETYAWSGYSWTKLGNSFSCGVAAYYAISAINYNTIAYIDSNEGKLSTYKWDNSDWALIGNKSAALGTTNYCMAAVSSTSIALLAPSNRQIKKYNWDGTDWTLEGTPTTNTPATATYGSMSRLDASNVAVYVASSTQTLGKYTWNGTTWPIAEYINTGDTSSIPRIAFLNSTDIAYINADDGILKTYRCNGVTWTNIGQSALSLAISSMCDLNSTDVAICDVVTKLLWVYRWNGSTWINIGSSFLFSDAPYIMTLLKNIT